MRKLMISGAMFSILACSAVEQEPVTRDAMQPQGAEPKAAAATDSAAFAEALERALATGWSELHVFDECRTDAGWTSLEIFGNGVAIWNRTAQFHLTAGEIRDHLELFQELGFAAMAERYGGRPEPEPGRPGSGESAIQVVCRVRLEIDGVAKEVVQLRKGEQSAELRELAEGLLELSEAPARAGVRAADLDDGLAKIAAGELAPETFELMLHRKPRNTEGWLLRVEGSQASTRELRPEGYADPVVLELRPEELAELAALMAERKIGELPINLYAEHYTDFKVRVLSAEHDVQARQFAGMTPERHGELQKRFDGLFAELYELHRRVLEHGRKAE